MKILILMSPLMLAISVGGCMPSQKIDRGFAACTISDSSEIINDSGKMLNDFGTPVGGCKTSFGPSGIVYHPILDRLIIVSDKDGQYATMKTDGTNVECKTITDVNGNGLDKKDHEGVTYADPSDGFIYIAVENEGEPDVAVIRQVELSSSRVTKSWKVEFPGYVKGRRGLESITFVRDESHAEGGTFYLGDQTTDKFIGKCDLPIKTGGDPNTVYKCSVEKQPGFEEVSGLDFNAEANIKGQQGVVFVSADTDNSIAAYSPDGEFLDWTRQFPESAGPGEEGHAFSGCNLYISADANNDARKIFSYRLSQ